MTIYEYLIDQDLITSSNNSYILTERAEYLGYDSVENLVTDIENTFLIDFKTKSIISAFRYLNNPIAVIGDSISDIVKFRVYNNTSLTSGIDLKNISIIPEIVWRNNENNLQGIFQVHTSDDETNKKIIQGEIISFDWIIDPRALYRSGNLEFSVRFVNYYYNPDDEDDPLNNTINYNLATQPTILKIEQSLNYISTLNEGDYNIISSFSNPYLTSENTYIIDCGNIDNNI